MAVIGPPPAGRKRMATYFGDGLDNTWGGSAGADEGHGAGGDDHLLGKGGNDLLFGDAGDDTLEGGTGADTLHGGGGGDILFGQSGDDLLFASADGSAEVLFGGNGVDTGDWSAGAGGWRIDLVAGLATDDEIVFTNVQSVENVTGSDFDDEITGDGNGNILDAGDGDDTVVGGGGNDVIKDSGGFNGLFGGHGDDVIDVLGVNFIAGGTGLDFLRGGFGDDTINGGGHDDTVLGRGGTDFLNGGGGADLINGQAGYDFLWGAWGDDIFRFSQLSDTTAAAPDTIYDLHDTDLIDLSGVDADVTAGGNQAFHLVGAFTGDAGELMLDYDSITDVTHLLGDVDGDGVADLGVELVLDHSSFANFVL